MKKSSKNNSEKTVDNEKEMYYKIINENKITSQEEFAKKYAETFNIPIDHIYQSDISKKFEKYNIEKINKRYQIETYTTLQNWIIDEYISTPIVCDDFKTIIVFAKNKSENLIKNILKKKMPPKNYGNYIFLCAEGAVVILCESKYCNDIVELINSLKEES